MALIKNNAKVAAQIAVELAKLQENNDAASFSLNSSAIAPLVIGGSILDIHYCVQEELLEVSFFNYFLK